MTTTQKSDERRTGRQRRVVDMGPPPGVPERRVNLERRLFDITVEPSTTTFQHRQPGQ